MASKSGITLLFLLALLASCFAFSFSAAASSSSNVKVNLRGVTTIAKTDDNFICATLDWWPEDKCDYGQCPWGKAGILNLDLKNEILFKAIKAFSPLRIRIGGSLEDQVIYNVGKAVPSCTNFTKQSDGLFGFSHGCFRMDRWDQIYNLLNESNAKVTFGLNALFGKVKLNGDDSYIGDWNSQNAEDFMKYTASKGFKIDSYELGNEMVGEQYVSVKIDALQYAKDMQVLKQLVMKVHPDPSSQPKVLGPAGFYDQQWFNTFLLASGPNVIDGVTHHIYNLGAGVDKQLINKIQDPFFLDQVAQTFKEVSDTVNQFGPRSGAWVGESGGAYNSGGKDVSQTFVNGYWYLDQLGMTSTFNHKVYCRQALIGGNYGLLNTTTFVPNPDYYGALLWHRLMGKNVLSITHNGSPYLRTYAHCSKTKPGVSILFINMDKMESFNVTMVNDMNLVAGPGEVKTQFRGQQKREEYHITPTGGNVQSDVVLLNGHQLRLSPSFDIPDMPPKLVDAVEPIVIAPHSYAFITIDQRPPSTCLCLVCSFD